MKCMYRRLYVLDNIEQFEETVDKYLAEIDLDVYPGEWTAAKKPICPDLIDDTHVQFKDKNGFEYVILTMISNQDDFILLAMTLFTLQEYEAMKRSIEFEISLMD